MLLAAIVLSGFCLPGSKGHAKESAKTASVIAANRAKARHFYLSAARLDAEGESAQAAELYKRAYETDSTYQEAALQYGIRRWGMPSDTLATPAEKERSKKIIRKFIDRYPGDFFPVMMYSNLMDRGNELEERLSALEGLREHNPNNTDLLQLLAGAYLDVHDFDKAMESIEAYEQKEGESIELTIRKAGMRLAMQDSLGAIAEVEKIMAKNPKEPQYMILKSQLYGYMNQPDSALAAAKLAEKMYEPGNGGPVKIQMAELYKEQGDSLNYDNKIYEALLAEDLSFEMKNDLMAYYLQNLVNQNGDRARGDKLFSVLLDQYPHEPALRSLAARYAASKGDYKTASEEIEYALDLDHRNGEYWEQALMYSIMLDDHDRTARIFDRARKSMHVLPMRLYLLAGTDAALADNNDRALELYAECLEDNFPGQKLDAAIDRKALGKYLTIRNLQDLVSLYQQAGDAFYKKGDRPDAFLNYENSLSLDPDNPLTLNNYAYFLVEEKQYADEEAIAKADEMSKSSISLAPENSTYLDTRAWVLFRKGDYRDAKEMQMKAIEAAGDEPSDSEVADLYSHLGDILFMNGEPDEAVKAWKKALKGDPENELLKKKIKNKAFFYE